MGNTEIIAARIHRIQWMDGWIALQDKISIRQPSIWVIDPWRSPQQSAHAEHLLSSEEIARAMRFHRTEHTLRFKATHTALRLLLGHATASDPAALRFSTGHHHKPKLADTTNTAIQFNLSYTENRALIGLDQVHPIGVDIEWLQRPLDIESMLDACFSAEEIAFIRAEKSETQHRFFTLWTRKEAILKLTGEGIGEHLPHFEVLDGVNRTKKQIIGGQPPDHVYLYSFPVEEGFIGCLASPVPVNSCSFYRL
ncbi:4'-phosphopantetheinyl transferase superfamily protein [Parapedobacter defluvii]|uniref:4'-phosphopantetheinyl transferase family protein n=1 Tax=Parapedobacter defluvii TaxID=2045106 RepID=UPI00333EDCCB